MSPREKLQRCYELAFYPPRLNELWTGIRKGTEGQLEEVGELLDTALLLHQQLPEGGVPSQRALNRFALYQAKARAFGMVRFLTNLRQWLGRPPLTAQRVPPHLIRDLALPRFDRSGGSVLAP